MALCGAAALASSAAVLAADKPNIVFILTDNLGYGEIGAYGGGITRGAATPCIDSIAKGGLRLLNMNMETQCTPSRSSPSDQGFDEWYGIPRTTDESLWPSAAGWSPEIMPAEHTMEGRKGERSRELKVYDVVERRLIDAEITRRSAAFIERQARGTKPFFAYVALTQPHLPTLPKARVPTDRPFDSLDQSDFLLGKTEKSAREDFPIFCAERLQAVKWRNWKMHFMRQDTMFDPPAKNPVPTIYNLFTDPREEKPTPDSWVVGPILKIAGAFEQSVKSHPLIPMGTPDPYTPAK